MNKSPANQKASLGRRFLRTLKGLLLWDHERASWQYDVMVVLILAFVFLIPKRYFHDRPVYNPGPAKEVVSLGIDADGTRYYRVSAELLARHHQDPRQAAEEVFSNNLDHPFQITRIEPVKDTEGSVVWYDVWLRGQN